MNERANPFSGPLHTPPAFATKPRKEKPVGSDAIDRIAKDHNFPSRDARKTSAPKRKPRIYRTGRNQHFGVKATAQTVERFYKAADERSVTLGRLLELALDALEKETVE